MSRKESQEKQKYFELKGNENKTSKFVRFSENNL